nr:RepA [Bothriochloa barbinodis associated virus]
MSAQPVSPLVSDSEGAGMGETGEVQSSPISAFELRGRDLFLTYARCPLEPAEVLQCLQNKCKKYTPTFIYVARESHADGDFHLHALIQCIKEFRTRSAKFFDLGSHHPNVQKSRNPKKTLDYCMKNPVKFHSYGTFVSPKPRKTKPTTEASRDAKLKQIISNATSKQEYLDMVRRAFPFEWAVRLHNFEYSASRLFPEVPPEYVSPYDPPPRATVEHQPTVVNWLQEELYSVSPLAYSIHAGVSEEQARLDLQWMADVSRLQNLEPVEEASTSADQQELERLLGPEVLDLITTGNTQ